MHQMLSVSVNVCADKALSRKWMQPFILVTPRHDKIHLRTKVTCIVGFDIIPNISIKKKKKNAAISIPWNRIAGGEIWYGHGQSNQSSIIYVTSCHSHAWLRFPFLKYRIHFVRFVWPHHLFAVFVNANLSPKATTHKWQTEPKQR